MQGLIPAREGPSISTLAPFTKMVWFSWAMVCRVKTRPNVTIMPILPEIWLSKVGKCLQYR